MRLNRRTASSLLPALRRVAPLAVAALLATGLPPIANARTEELSEGPWLLARLPAGTYAVNAAYGRSMEHRSVTVGATSLRTVDFRWPTE